MEERITQLEGLEALEQPKSSVGVAVNGSRSSKYVIQWALDKFIPEGELSFNLLFIRHKIISVPTPMGNSIPISQVREDVATAFRKEMEWQANEKLLPYKMMFARRKLQVEIIQIESDDVVMAITDNVAKGNINKLVIGASSRSLFSRGRNLSSRISDCTPSFCTVYVVSKGKLSSIRPSDSERNESTRNDHSDTSSSSFNSSFQTDCTDQSSTSTYSQFCSSSLPQQRLQALKTMNQQALFHGRMNSNESIFSRSLSHSFGETDDDDDAISYLSSSDVNDVYGTAASSFRSLMEDNQSWSTDSAPPSDFSSQSQVNINFELEKLRVELRHLRGMYAMAQSEAIDADHVKECAEIEAEQKREAAAKALYEAKEKEKLEDALVGPVKQYQKFTWEEIKYATLSFSEDLRVGMGAYGSVYKCSLGHTTAAIKVLRSKDAYRSKQFQQEIEILSKIRHPHLLILLGACPDHGCLAYEFMENGSLEDRLLRKNNSSPLPWFERCRIAWEVASGLAFLHKSKPKPIIHRDLKPANILLDHNLVSKIGDVGLSTMLQLDPSSLSTSCTETGPVGTFCYIDPEYQRTGLVSPKSDVYALGIVILQLLTAKPAIALAHLVEKAIENDCINEVLDEDAGEWPIEKTKKLAAMALKCTELRGKDRPDLNDEVLPVLEKLKDIANKARDLASTARTRAPNHFICPILKEVMEEPHVAADGYTYDRKAIEAWL